MKNQATIRERDTDFTFKSKCQPIVTDCLFCKHLKLKISKSKFQYSTSD